MAAKPVAIIMGSQSDWATMKHAAETLDALGSAYEARIVSAHRTPERLYDFADSARKSGFKVIIAGAGGAAHLPGMTASMTPLPVLGVPMNTHALEGKDSLLSIMQMPAGIPVGTLAIGKPGAINAALLAAAVLALSDAGSPSGSTLGAHARPKPWPRRPKDLSLAAQTRRDHRHSRRRPARAACWRWRQRRSVCDVTFIRPKRTPAPSTSCTPGTCAAYDDEAALGRFAGAVDVITYEFENVPAKTAAFLARRKPVLPDPQVLETTQDRLIEKNFISAI